MNRFMTLLSRRWGCLLAALTPVVAIMLFLFGVSLDRTVSLEAVPIVAGDVELHLEAADFRESTGAWPIVSTVTYVDNGRIRGEIRQRASAGRTTDFRVVITSREGVSRVTHCYPDYKDACYFDVDLGRTNMTKGIQVTVLNPRDGRVVIAPRAVGFSRSTSYSSARWDALMGI